MSKFKIEDFSLIRSSLSGKAPPFPVNNKKKISNYNANEKDLDRGSIVCVGIHLEKKKDRRLLVK